MPIRAWSTNAADNDDADVALGVDWREGMAPGQVNNSARALMAEVAKWDDDNNGSLVAGGSANAISLTTNQTITSLLDGDMLTFRAPGTNTGATTVNVNGTGAKSLKKDGGTALVGGEVISGGIYRVTYVQASDEFRLHSGAANPTGYPGTSAFVEFTTYTTISTVIPADDTQPLVSEGAQILSVPITPSTSSNKIRGTVSVPFALSGTSAATMAVFRGSTLVKARIINGSGPIQEMFLAFEDSPATTSAVTYTVRVGPAASTTVYVNGNSGGRFLGGAQSAAIHVWEVKA